MACGSPLGADGSVGTRNGKLYPVDVPYGEAGLSDYSVLAAGKSVSLGDVAFFPVGAEKQTTGRAAGCGGGLSGESRTGRRKGENPGYFGKQRFGAASPCNAFGKRGRCGVGAG